MSKDRSSSPNKEHPAAEADRHVLSSRTEDLKKLLALTIVAGIALSIIFRNEPVVSVIKITIGLLWMFLLPGMFLLDRARTTLPFLTRLIISVPLSAGLFGLISYPLGIAGIGVQYHGWLIPGTIIVGTVIYQAIDRMKK